MLWLSKAQGLPITTKVHRVTRHVKYSLIRFDVRVEVIKTK